MSQDKGLIAVGFLILATLFDTITLPIRFIAGFLGAPYAPMDWASLWADLLDDNSDGGLV